jgi:hypothetical protein
MQDAVELAVAATRPAEAIEKELAGCLRALKRVRADMQRANRVIAKDGIMARMETMEGRPRATSMHASATKMAKRLDGTIAELKAELEKLKPKEDDLANF